MRLEIEGLTRQQEIAWLISLPWTITSEPADDPGEFVVRVAEMPDAIAIGTEKEVGRDIWDSLRASLECRLDFNDPIPVPRSLVVPQPLVVVPAVSPSENRNNDSH